MLSFFGWIGFSESERRRVMEAIDTLRQKDARDELGLGAIRDGFADLLLPGTGTVQTRARYFLFVPWIYRDLEFRGKDPAEIPRLARDLELGLIDALEAGGEKEGIIGIVARRRLKRLPSSIYWLGLQRWRICQARGSQDDFHRALRRGTGPAGLVRNDDGEVVEGGQRAWWHAGLPPRPADLQKTATFHLSRREAEYLRERIVTTAAGTLLSYLVSEGGRWKKVDFPWEHPLYGEFPGELKVQLREARRLSEEMHGAALLYNLLLAEMTRNDELVDAYESVLGEWAEDRRSAVGRPEGGWPDAPFWAQVARGGRAATSRTQAFVRDWVAHVNDVVRGAAPDDRRARELVTRRELEVKGGRKARLHDASARALWNGGAGIGRIDYRWTSAQRILLDIREGLEKGKRDA